MATARADGEVREGPFARARRFLQTEARLLERRLFAVRFEAGDPEAVRQLVRAYRNPDGGLGHALEPDLRCAESQPLFAEVGLTALQAAGVRDPDLAQGLCGFLETVADPATGLVPILRPGALAAPHAAHWRQTGPPALNPTAGLCGLLHAQGVDHPWLARATRTCCDLARRAPPAEAHALYGIARLAEHLPDADLAERLAEAVAATLPRAAFFVPHAPVTTYGLTPLHFAPAPPSRWRALFTAAQIDRHLADLAAQQRPAGGWPLSWTAPGAAATCEYRGIWTLLALTILVDYGVVDVEG